MPQTSEQPITDERSGADSEDESGRREPLRETLPGSPFARHRDADGNPAARNRPGERPLPARGDLARTYNSAVDRIARQFPLRAANLRDIMARVDTMIARRIEMIAEEERERNRYNEALAEYDAAVDKKRDALHAKRAEMAMPFDEKIDQSRKSFAEARARYTADLATMGRGFRVRDWGAGDDPEVTQNSPEIGKDDVAPIALISSSAAPHSDESKSITPHPSHGLLDSLARRFNGAPGSRLHWGRGNPPSASAPGPASTPPAAPTTEPAANIGSDPARDLERPHRPPIVVEFPKAYIDAQTEPASAIAIAQSLPPILPSGAVVEPKNRLLSLYVRVMVGLATVATGSIFGISIAILLGAIDTQSLAFGGPAVLITAGVCALIGICMFWAIGRSVQILTATFAEALFQSQILWQGDDSERAAQAQQRTAYWTAGIALLCVIALIVIEANVERAGVVTAFLSNEFTARVASGAAITQIPASSFQITSLCLIACLPYVLMHASDSWARTRAHLLAAHLAAKRESAVWKDAQTWHVEVQNESQDDLDKDYEQDREDYDRYRKMRGSVRDTRRFTPASNSQDGASDPAEQPGDTPSSNSALSAPSRFESAPLAAGEPETVATADTAAARQGVTTRTDGPRDGDVEGEIGDAEEVAPSPEAPEGDTLVDARPFGESLFGTEAKVRLACSCEAARYAYSELRLAYRRRREALAGIEARIAALGEDKRYPRLKLSVAARQRIDDAEGDLVQAVKSFDELFAAEQKRFETWARGGIWWRFIDFFARRPDSASGGRPV